MDYGPYSAIYDDEYEDYKDDVQFYVRMARRCPSPALELGCGTGRVLIPVARAGHPVWGLDCSASMLARLSEKLAGVEHSTASRIQLVEGDMTDFNLDERFGLIYMPFREWMHLNSVDEQMACLSCIHRHLRADGKLVVNLYDADLTTLALQQKSEDVPVYRQKLGDYTDRATGHKVMLTSASTYVWHEQLLDEERFYDRLDENGVVAERRVVFLKQRWTFRWEMHHLLHRCGFRVESLYGGYQGGPPQRMGSEMIWVARPATHAELQEELEVLQERLAR